MKGLPRRIATLADLDVLRGFIGSPFDAPAHRDAIRKQLVAIRETHEQYVYSRTLSAETDRAGPEPQYRVLAVTDEAGATSYQEFERLPSPHSRLQALGVSAAELDALIDEVSA